MSSCTCAGRRLYQQEVSGDRLASGDDMTLKASLRLP
jgi:hypothetical protein